MVGRKAFRPVARTALCKTLECGPSVILDDFPAGQEDGPRLAGRVLGLPSFYKGDVWTQFEDCDTFLYRRAVTAQVLLVALTVNGIAIGYD
jgi:hypothetical protein